MSSVGQQMPVTGQASHRGVGTYVPLSSYGSSSRTMSPPFRARSVPAPTGPGNRYGSAEPRNDLGSRNRERDRDRSQSRISSRNMGPQETMDWDKLISDIHDRLNAVERNQRNQAQDISRVMVHADAVKADYPAYKDYVEGRF